MSLYNKIIKNISYAVYQSINEMARLKINRTIDKKLWLSVASTCSRNKSTEAEFIKPTDKDKNILLLKYVAALLIMKKECPLSKLDIESLKTFKQVGNKLIDLGVTFDEIQKLYNENNGNITSVAKSMDTPTNIIDEPNETDNIEVKNNVSTLSISNDDDLFSDIDFEEDPDEGIGKSELIQIVGAPKDMSIINTLVTLYNIKKPRGWLLVYSTNDSYEQLTYIDNHRFSAAWGYKALTDMKELFIDKNNYISFELDEQKLYGWKYNFFYAASLSDKDMKTYITRRTALLNKRPYNLYSVADVIKDLKLYKKDIERKINSITNKTVQEMFLNDPSIIGIYISPDGGIVEIDKIIGKYEPNVPEYESSSSPYTITLMHIITFTGKVDYSDYSEEIANRKLSNIKEENLIKILTKKFYKNVYKFTINSSGWQVEMDPYTDLPMLLVTGGTSVEYLRRRMVKSLGLTNVQKHKYSDSTEEWENDRLYIRFFIRNKKNIPYPFAQALLMLKPKAAQEWKEYYESYKK